MGASVDLTVGFAMVPLVVLKVGSSTAASIDWSQASATLLVDGKDGLPIGTRTMMTLSFPAQWHGIP